MNGPRLAVRAIQGTASTPDQVAGEVKRKRRNRRRTRNATILRRIEARVRERRTNWDDLAKTPIPDREDDLTELHEAVARKLGHDYEDLRTADRKDYADGTPGGDLFRRGGLERS